jgi:hypothetical protein
MRRTRPGRARLGRALVAAVALVATAVPSALAAADEGLCDDEVAAAGQVEALVRAHNARLGPGPYPPAIARPFNAEANDLRLRRDAADKVMAACLLTDRLLTGEAGGPPVKLPTTEMVQKMQDATRNLNPDRPRSGQSADKGGYGKSADLVPLYDVVRPIRHDFGDVQLQGRNQPKENDPDPAYSGKTIQRAKGGGPAVSVDHIVPLYEIFERPGFLRLSPENMYLVVNAPINLQWLSFRANNSKGSRSMAYVSGVDDAFWSEQIQLEANALSRLDRLIQHLLATQK